MTAVDLSGDWLKAIFTAATLLISYAGYRLSQRGQDVSNREAHFAQEFAALKQVNETLVAENARQRADIAEARKDAADARAVVRTEWEPRWSRQMDRCRKVTDALVASVIALHSTAPPKKKAQAEAALHDLEEHRAHDHIEASELDD